MADADPSAGGILIGDQPEEDTQETSGSEGTSEPTATDGSGDGGKRPGWMDQLEGDLKDHGSLRKYKSASALAKGYVELEGKLGKSVIIPGNEATEEERSRFFSQIGRPEKPEGYDFSKATLPKGVKLTKDTEGAIREVSHELGLTNDQASGVAAAVASRDAAIITAVVKANKAMLKDGIAELKEEWGSSYDENMSLAHRAISHHFGQDFLDLLRKSGMDQYPKMVKGAVNIARATLESEAPGGVRPDTGKLKTSFPEAEKAAAKRREVTPIR